MKNFKINPYFQEEFLSVGKVRDNLIFENCPLELIEEAEILLEPSSDTTKSCVIKITENIGQKLEQTLEKCDNNSQKEIIARDLFVSMFMLELLKHIESSQDKSQKIRNGIESLLSGSLERAKEYIFQSPMPLEIYTTAKKVGKIELNIFIINNKNKYLQQAINNFVASREPYSIKIFSDSNLISYLDQNGEFIQSPHDYISMNVNKILTYNEPEL